MMMKTQQLDCSISWATESESDDWIDLDLVEEESNGDDYLSSSRTNKVVSEIGIQVNSQATRLILHTRNSCHYSAEKSEDSKLVGEKNRHVQNNKARGLSFNYQSISADKGTASRLFFGPDWHLVCIIVSLFFLAICRGSIEWDTWYDGYQTIASEESVYGNEASTNSSLQDRNDWNRSLTIPQKKADADLFVYASLPLPLVSNVMTDARTKLAKSTQTSMSTMTTSSSSCIEVPCLLMERIKKETDLFPSASLWLESTMRASNGLGDDDFLQDVDQNKWLGMFWGKYGGTYNRIPYSGRSNDWTLKKVEQRTKLPSETEWETFTREVARLKNEIVLSPESFWNDSTDNSILPQIAKDGGSVIVFDGRKLPIKRFLYKIRVRLGVESLRRFIGRVRNLIQEFDIMGGRLSHVKRGVDFFRWKRKNH